MSTELFIACLSGLCLITGTLLTFILNSIASHLKSIGESVSSLNEKIAIVITRVDNHETRLNKIESLKKQRRMYAKEISSS